MRIFKLTFVFISFFFSISAFADFDTEKCAAKLNKLYSAEGAYGGGSVGYIQTYNANQEATLEGTSVQFPKSGHLWRLIDSYASGTGVTAVLTNSRCEVLFTTNVYSE